MENKNQKEIEFSEIGKRGAIEKLFEESGYVNERIISLSEKGECCIVNKVLLEGVDFDLTFNPMKHLGYKAVLSVVGEIYSKIYRPISINIVVAMSNRFSFKDAQELWSGITAAMKEHSIKHISFDLVPSAAGLVISISSCGVQKRGILENLPSPKSFDLICISGDLGAAYMGLHVLEREKISFSKSSEQPDLDKYKYILQSYLRPEIKSDIIERFESQNILPSKGYFITKGLASAVKNLSSETCFGAKIYLEKIPISSSTFSMAEEINMDAITAAMNGGDDFKFLFTIPIEKHETFKKEFQDYDVIGHLSKKEVGTVLVTPEGAEIEINSQDF